MAEPTRSDRVDPGSSPGALRKANRTCAPGKRGAMVRWPGVAARGLTANQVTHSRPRVRISLSPPMDAQSDLVTEPGQNPGEPRPCRFDSCRIRWPRPSWSTGPVRYTGVDGACPIHRYCAVRFRGGQPWRDSSVGSERPTHDREAVSSMLTLATVGRWPSGDGSCLISRRCAGSNPARPTKGWY